MLGFKNKEIFCYDSSIALCGVVDDYTSFIFERSYSGIGEWQIVISGYSKNAEYLKAATYIKCGEGVAGIITKISENNTDGEYSLTFTGVELKGLIQKRIVIPPVGESHLKYTSKSPEYIIAGIIYTQLLGGSASNRRINGVLAAWAESTQTITYEGRFSNAAEDIAALAETYQIGWFADIENNQIVWHIYHGFDRTANQTANSRLIIANGYDTMAGSTYERAYHTSNTALVAGQGEGVERSTVLINNVNSGLNRTEVYIDARDIKEDELLPQRGAEKLAEYGTASTFEIIPTGYLINNYRTAYDLGDVGTYKDQNIDFRLTAIREVYENNQFTLQYTFGYDAATLSASLKRMETRTEALVALEGSNSESGVILPVPVAQGGTGATEASSAIANLGAAAAIHTHSQSDVDGTVPISKGGTGATNAATALANLGVNSLVNTAIANKKNKITYQTAETLTGDTWIDGKPIYRKIIRVASVAKSANATVGTIANLDSVVKLSGFGKTGNMIFPINYSPNSLAYIQGAYFDGTSLKIQTGSNRAFTNVVIIVEYTKQEE